MNSSQQIIEGLERARAVRRAGVTRDAGSVADVDCGTPRAQWYHGLLQHGVPFNRSY